MNKDEWNPDAAKVSSKTFILPEAHSTVSPQLYISFKYAWLRPAFKGSYVNIWNSSSITSLSLVKIL